MSETQRFPFVTDAQFDEVSRLGDAIYEKLKPQLVQEHDREFITIHVDTEDYAIGKIPGYRHEQCLSGIP